MPFEMLRIRLIPLLILWNKWIYKRIGFSNPSTTLKKFYKQIAQDKTAFILFSL